MFNLTHLKLIVEGKIEPKTEGEVAFYAAYLSGLSGILLTEFLIETPSHVLDRNDFDLLIHGYCWGQRELDNEYDVVYIKKVSNERYYQ